jgi:hypothetical protein
VLCGRDEWANLMLYLWCVAREGLGVRFQLRDDKKAKNLGHCSMAFRELGAISLDNTCKRQVPRSPA